MMKLKPLGKVTVVTAGTRVQITASDIRTGSIAIQADSANVGKVYIGDSSVSSSIRLGASANEIVSIDASDLRGNTEEFSLSDFYVDAETNGNSVHVFYLGRR
jgi:hypothetical protein